MLAAQVASLAPDATAAMAQATLVRLVAAAVAVLVTPLWVPTLLAVQAAQVVRPVAVRAALDTRVALLVTLALPLAAVVVVLAEQARWVELVPEARST